MKSPWAGISFPLLLLLFLSAGLWMYILLGVHASHLFVWLCICVRIQGKMNRLCTASQRELICLGLSHLFYKTGDGCIK